MADQHPRATERQLDYFGHRPGCGCITAWMTSDSTQDEIAEFAREMRQTGRDVIRGTLDEYRDKLDRCPHGEPDVVPRSDAETLARAVSASLTHGERSPLAAALSVYLAKHPWSDL